jgi:signal peptidase I
MSAKITKRSLLFHVFDVTLNIVIIVAIVALIRTFVVSPFQIEGNSMIDTLEHKEYIVINKFRYLFGHPGRGDIVVFRPPSDPSKYYVKRVIGLPGETVVVRNGYIYIRENGEEIKLDEPYLGTLNGGKTYRYPVQSGDTTEEVFTVPDNEYFLLGDNRQGSLDSRSFGHVGTGQTAYVPEKNIKGSVWFVALPITKIHAFAAPEYEGL